MEEYSYIVLHYATLHLNVRVIRGSDTLATPIYDQTLEIILLQGRHSHDLVRLHDYTTTRLYDYHETHLNLRIIRGSETMSAAQ